MDNIAQRLKAYIEAHPFDPGDSDCETVLDQLYQVYQESHESDVNSGHRATLVHSFSHSGPEKQPHLFRR